jgi:hypothetical protein
MPSDKPCAKAVAGVAAIPRDFTSSIPGWYNTSEEESSL